MNGEQSHDHYDDNYRNIDAGADEQGAFMFGQLLHSPASVFGAEISRVQQEIADATAAGDNSQKICALHFELKHLKMVQIEAEGVYRNAHSAAAEE